MNARILGLVGVVAAVVAGCKSDPTNSVVGTPARVGFQFRTLRITVADSTPTFATVLDQGSNPLVNPVTITACDPTTIAVAHVASGAPLVQTNFYVKGMKYGTACVVATANGLTDTMQVAALPDHITVSSGPDTVVSGVPATYGFTWFDKANDSIKGPPAPTWSAGKAALGKFTDAVAGTYAGRDTGVGSVIVSESFSLLGGTVTQTITNNKTVATIAAAFNGTTNSPVPPGGTLVVTANAGGPAYDGTTQVWFGAAAQTTDTTGIPTTVTAAIPDLAAWGPISMGVKGVGAGEITQVGPVAVQVPPLYSGTVSSATAFPGQLLTLTKGASDPAWGSLSRAFFNSTRAWIIDTTSTIAHIALPPAFQTGKTLLLLTRMADASALASQDTLNSLDSTAYDQYDKVSAAGAVQNSPGTGPLVSTDTTLFITLSGSCPSGGPTVGGGSVTSDENCDDWIQVKNTKATDDTAVTLSLQWQKSAEIGATQDLDSYWIADTTGLADFSAFCVVDGCAGASSANPEQTTVVIPAGQTYYILINMFNIRGLRYALAKVTIGGL